MRTSDFEMGEYTYQFIYSPNPLVPRIIEKRPGEKDREISMKRFNSLAKEFEKSCERARKECEEIYRKSEADSMRFEAEGKEFDAALIALGLTGKPRSKQTMLGLWASESKKVGLKQPAKTLGDFIKATRKKKAAQKKKA